MDFYSTPGLPVAMEPWSQPQQATTVALLPSSGTAKSSSTRTGGSRLPPVTPGGQLKSYSPADSRHRKRYAIEDDWRTHKDRISSLYQRKRLKDVITVMETQHQFFATERMYKARFKEWGLEKNVTAAKVHQLMRKVEEAGRIEGSPSRSGGRGGNERIVLDVGEDLDVRRIQKYMKRRPVGLGKLPIASKRSLEVIKSLSVDSGKGGSGRVKVSIPVVKLDQQRRESTPELCLSTFSMEWPSGSELPSDAIGLLQAFVDNHFDCPYPFTSIGNSSFMQIYRHDETMLDLALKFRIAHILLDDELAGEGMRIISVCLESFAFCVQQAQHTSPLDTRPATQLILWALSLASDMMSDLRHSKKIVLQMLLQRMVALCAGYQPTFSELISRISHLGASGQVAMLKLARSSISQALFVAAEYEPAFETFLRTVEIGESPLSPEAKFQALQRISSSTMVRNSPVLEGWMETRMALSVAEAPPPVETLNQYGEGSSPSWQAQGHDRIGEVVGAIAVRLGWHKAAGNWQVAQQLESRYGSIVQAVWGGYTETAPQGTGGDLDIWSSPEQATSSLAPEEQGGFHMAAPEMTLRMGHGHLVGEIQGEIPGWEELQPPPPQHQQQQQRQAQILSQGVSSSTSSWTAADVGNWQMGPDFGTDRRSYHGSY